MSARTRTFLVVGALAALAAVVVASVAVLSAQEEPGRGGRGAGSEAAAGLPTARALPRDPRRCRGSRDLRRAAVLYEQGKRQEAAAIFSRYDSLEAKLGSAFAAWPASEDRIEQLGALYPRSSLVQLHVGLSRFWAGLAGAQTAWREARDVEPDTPYAVRAGDLLHPEFAPGLPGFIVSFDYKIEGETPADQLRRLAADRTLRGRLLYGIALQGLGRPSRRAAPSRGARAGAERRRRARRRRGRPLRQGKSVGVVLPSRPAQPPLPARGDRALPPRPAAALAAGREGGDAPARARARGRAGKQDRRRGEALPRCGSQRRDLLIERWAERPMALRRSSGKLSQLCEESVANCQSRGYSRSAIGGGAEVSAGEPPAPSSSRDSTYSRAARSERCSRAGKAAGRACSRRSSRSRSTRL